MKFVEAFEKTADVLTATARKHIKPKNFVFPKQRAFPIEDLAHGKAALSRAHFASDPAKVRAAVYKKYPALKARHMEREGK